jgi:DNA-binding transcriptional LysR family regulator
MPQAAGRLFLDDLIIRFLARYPQMRLEIASEARMIDIVAEGYDAGIRLAESVPQDMIAVPLTPDIRMRVVATPAWFAEHGTPETPEALTHHQGICMRMSHGGVYRWEMERHGEHFAIAVPAVWRPPIFLPLSVRCRLGWDGFLPEFYIEDFFSQVNW